MLKPKIFFPKPTNFFFDRLPVNDFYFLIKKGAENLNYKVLLIIKK